ncbi:MAG: hypothetical protein ACYDD6_06270 [Acidimicrobiales bacterium]
MSASASFRDSINQPAVDGTFGGAKHPHPGKHVVAGKVDCYAAIFCDRGLQPRGHGPTVGAKPPVVKVP